MNAKKKEEKTTETIVCNATQIRQLEKIMHETDWEFFDHQSAYFRAKQGNVTVVAYKSGAVVVTGPKAEVNHILDTVIQSGISKESLKDGWTDHIGVDESGKGDFFGPLVIAGAVVGKDEVSDLVKLGVRDSKKIRDKKVIEISQKLRKKLSWDVVTISPSKYNELYKKMRNINKILAWGHARIIENLLEKTPNCTQAVSDQFASFKGRLERALMEKGRQITLEQMHGGESDLAVAAASIIARGVFLESLAEMEKKYGMHFPKGASNGIIDTARNFCDKYEKKRLDEVAKMNFSTARKV